MAIEDSLATWLGNQRWFAGKGLQLRDLTIVSDTEIIAGDPGLRHLIMAASHASSTDYYQVLLGLRGQLPSRLEHARIGTYADGRAAYDGLQDADLTRSLLTGIAGEATAGPLRMHRIPGAEFDAGLDSMVLGAEQSNTSLIYGDQSILKVFRRLAPGPNPDLEVSTALAHLGSPQVPEPLGWIETELAGVTTSLAILSRYLRLATDGWTLAATSVRDLYAASGDATAQDASVTGPMPVIGSADLGPAEPLRAADAGGDFAGESRRLGAATAHVHADLAAAFGTDLLGSEAAGELARGMQHRLDAAAAAVPELAKHADMVSDAYRQVAKLPGPFPVQRVHGDYHLGQVLRTESGWIVLDFEGEPAAPLEQRRAKSSPLRDVAGMLRSFDYAARHQLIGRPDEAELTSTARDWARRNASAFCTGYAEAGGLDPVANHVLMRALQLEKAVYEVLYEARHRPSWLPIPLDSLAEF